jgi:heavy metal sensor kinase
MSLRSRLTFLYAALLGGIFLVFGVTVYGLVTYFLTTQADELLVKTLPEVLETMKIDSVGNVIFWKTFRVDAPAMISVQVWSREGTLLVSSDDILSLDSPLDPYALSSHQLVFRDVWIGRKHFRVCTVPLVAGGRHIATLQEGMSMEFADSVRHSLLHILVIASIFLILLSGGISWFALGHALSPLEDVVDTARQINSADDLSRRIPYHGPPHDEVGQLIYVFNQTLERLEMLFSSQHRFLADVSHELRTPLTVIKGNVGLMRRMKTVDEETLASIDQEVNRLTRLVGDLLLLSKAESGTLPLSRDPVSLDTLLLEVFREMSVLAGNKIHLKLTEIDQIQVLGDRDRLKQVLLNLMGNAIQYTPEGGEVFVGLSKRSGRARIVVRDTGPGIPEEDLAHIFDRFYRAEKSRTRESGGVGLGLSIAQWIVTRHGGEIVVDSKEGEGTAFYVWLPLLEENELSST